MWNRPKDVKQPQDVEQAQRGGTEERSAVLFSALKKMGVALDVEQVFDVEQHKDVEQPKDVEQAQRGGTEERSAILFSALNKNGCRPRCGTSL